MNRLLQSYKDEKRGPTLVAIQSANDLSTMASQIQLLNGTREINNYIFLQTEPSIGRFGDLINY